MIPRLIAWLKARRFRSRPALEDRYPEILPADAPMSYWEGRRLAALLGRLEAEQIAALVRANKERAATSTGKLGARPADADQRNRRSE